jgi:hypothetical protein
MTNQIYTEKNITATSTFFTEEDLITLQALLNGGAEP